MVYTDICKIEFMKTTLNLHDALVMEAKALAVRQRSTLTRLIEEGLRMRLRSEQLPPAKLMSTMPPMPVFPVLPGKGGLMPGIDGTSNRSMFDAADDVG